MKDIPGYEGLYEITADLEIRNIKSGRILKIFLNIDGYSVVGLFQKGKQKQLFMHRIVAELFVPNPENKPQVNHINGIKTDFRPVNLEWCTQSENQNHAYRTGLQIGYGLSGEKAAKAKLTLDLTTGIYYGCLKDAATARGINPAYIRTAINQGFNKTGIVYV